MPPKRLVVDPELGHGGEHQQSPSDCSDDHTLPLMQAFKALSFSDRWRVRRFVFRGEAPDDPRMAAAAIELAERYQRRDHPGILGWGMAFLLVCFSVLLIWAAIDGNVREIVISGAWILIAAAHLAFNPVSRTRFHGDLFSWIQSSFREGDQLIPLSNV